MGLGTRRSDVRALDRQPSIIDWLRQWLPCKHPTVLWPDDWFDVGHGLGKGTVNHHGVWVSSESSNDWFIWHPPPALGEIAMEELSESRHKRSHLSHIVLLPRLMTFSWRRRLSKICDLVFEIPPGSRSFWPHTEHEPLVIGLTLRFSSVSPWQARFDPCILDLEGQLRRVWADPVGSERALLQQFCDTPRRMEGL